jgi:hypothetical protein
MGLETLYQITTLCLAYFTVREIVKEIIESRKDN